MPRKNKKLISKDELEQRQGAKAAKDWDKLCKALEDKGLHGADWFVRRVDELEAKVKILEAKLKRKAKK